MANQFVYEVQIPMTLEPGVGSKAYLMEELWYVRASVSREIALGGGFYNLFRNLFRLDAIVAALDIAFEYNYPCISTL